MIYSKTLRKGESSCKKISQKYGIQSFHTRHCSCENSLGRCFRYALIKFFS